MRRMKTRADQMLVLSCMLDRGHLSVILEDLRDIIREKIQSQTSLDYLSHYLQNQELLLDISSKMARDNETRYKQRIPEKINSDL